MPYEVSWLVPQKVILTRYIGEVSIEEITDAASTGVYHMSESDAKVVHNIIDISELQSHPNRVRELNEILKPLLSHPSMGWNVVYGMQNVMTRFVVETLSHVARSRFRAFANRHKALEFLTEIDVELDLNSA